LKILGHPALGICRSLIYIVSFMYLGYW